VFPVRHRRACGQVDAADPWGISITNGEFTAFTSGQWGNQSAESTQVVVQSSDVGGPVKFVNSDFWGPSTAIARLEGVWVLGVLATCGCGGCFNVAPFLFRFCCCNQRFSSRSHTGVQPMHFQRLGRSPPGKQRVNGNEWHADRARMRLSTKRTTGGCRWWVDTTCCMCKPLRDSRNSL